MPLNERIGRAVLLLTVAILVFSFPGSIAFAHSISTGSSSVPAAAGSAGLTLAPSTHALYNAPPSSAAPAPHPTAGHAPVKIPSNVVNGRPAPNPPVLKWDNSPQCQADWAKWNATWNNYGAPLDVRHWDQSPCYIGHDEPGLNYLSNGTDSASRVHFTIDLPANGTNTASAFSTFWVGMWLSGVPCSYRGLSYLEVQINPPYSALGLAPTPNWTVQAPVWDLVPAGSCDPQCQNGTAFNTIAGIPYCEDDAALRGVGIYTPTGWGGFFGGDRITVDMVGVVNGTGLTVYLNDTTNPGQSINWTYSGSVSTSGLPLNPAYSVADFHQDGWGYGYNVEATWENCPEAQGFQACNSYNQPAVNAVGVPNVIAATFWNATTSSYSNQYTMVATTSSAAGCSGLAAPCWDYNQWGGTSWYPYWSVHAWGGTSWWTYGGTYPHEVNNFGTAAGQFDPFAAPVVLDPTTIYEVSNVTSSTNVSFDARVADPAGVQAVQIGGYWCFGSSTPSVVTATATLAGGPYDTNQDGNWTAMLLTYGYTGTFNYWVKAESTAGVWTNPMYGSASVTSGGSGSCGFPAPAAPVLSVGGITPTGGGFILNWTEASPGIANYTIWFNATGPNNTWFPVNVGPQTVQNIQLYWSNQSFNITIVAYTYAGLSSAMSVQVTSPSTLFYLQAALVGPIGQVFWVGNANITETAYAFGGMAPYTYRFVFRDGTMATVVSNNSTVTIQHDFGMYYGNARTSVLIWDALGDVAASGRQMVQIWATPLGVPQTISAGDGWVNISWSTPISPAAPVTYYSVYYTPNPAWATQQAIVWPYNYTPAAVTLWNTTQHYLMVPVPDGVTLYAQVCAWNIYGEGLLTGNASSVGFLMATPAPLSIGPIQAGAPGGAAPFTTSFSTMVTLGTNGVIASSLYSFPGGATVTPTVEGGNGVWWVNGSYTFPTPGVQTVVLHVTDAFLDIGVATTSVAVSSGAAPTVAVVANASTTFVGVPVGFVASGSGGSGQFTYAWNYGDASAAGAGASVSHAWLSAGTFTVTAWATDNQTQGKASWTGTVIVLALPQVAIVTGAGPNGSMSYTFSAAYWGGAGASSYVWTFGDGSVGSGATVNHDYASSGSYTVTVIATDSTHKVAQSSVTVAVASTGGTTSSSSLTGTNAALLAGVGILAVIFLIGMVYFWSKSRRPPVMMAPEGSSSGNAPR